MRDIKQTTHSYGSFCSFERTIVYPQLPLPSFLALVRNIQYPWSCDCWLRLRAETSMVELNQGRLCKNRNCHQGRERMQTDNENLLIHTPVTMSTFFFSCCVLIDSGGIIDETG